MRIPTRGSDRHRRRKRLGVDYAPHRPGRSRNRLTRELVRGRERLAVGAFRAASSLVGRVPTPVADPLARALFRGAYHVWPAKRRIILANAAHVLHKPTSDPEVARLARAIYASYARFVLELMRLPSRPADEPTRMTVDEGGRGHESFARLYERLREEGRGMVSVSAHLGSIDILAGGFAARGYPTYGVADDSAYPELFELLNEQRRRWGSGVIPWRNLREMYRAVRRGGIVGLVVDWGYRPDDVPVRLFGAWTTLPAGPAILAARTGAPIVPAVSRRRADGRFEAIHFDPIEVADDRPSTVARVMQRIADAVEEMIAAAPEQWYSFKPIWPASQEEERRLAERHAAMLRDDLPDRVPGATPARPAALAAAGDGSRA